MNNEENKELLSLKEITSQGYSYDELIVALNFEYDGTTYQGRRIMSRDELGKLCAGLMVNREITIPNNRGGYYDLHVSTLDRSFTIHSDIPEDVESMRNQSGESVGDTSLFDSVIERDGWCSSVIIDKQSAEDFLEDPLEMDFTESTGINDDAAELLSNYDGDLFFRELESISDAAIESLSKHRGNLTIGGLSELSDAAAESLSKHRGRLSIGALSSLSDAAAESLSRHQGNLEFFQLSEISDNGLASLSKLEGDLDLGWEIYELSDAAAESFLKHKGDLFLNGISELSDAAANHLSKKAGTICRMDPAAWVASLNA